MIREVLVRLDLEVVLRVTPMLLEVERELVGRFEQIGEDVLPDLDNRIAVIDDVEVNRSVVGVDHRFD